MFISSLSSRVVFDSMDNQVIVDPGIHNQPGYAPYDQGLAQNLFIKKQSGDVFIGKVWPGTTAFPDFLNPNATYVFVCCCRFHELG